MFYCQPCGEKNDWPVYGFARRSWGPCEICKDVTHCFDVPSSALPRRVPEKQQLVRLYTQQFSGLREALIDPSRLDIDTLLPRNIDDYISKAEALSQTLRDIKLLQRLGIEERV